MMRQLTNITLFKLIVLFVLTTSFGRTYAQINVLWESRYTSVGQNSDQAKKMALDGSGNIYVTGTSKTNAINGFDIVTIKYDPSGNELWAKTFNGSGSALDEARDIAVDASGNVYVTGYTTSSGVNFDYITIKYDPSGNELWAVVFDEDGFDEAYAIALDGSGNVYVTGGAFRNNGDGTNFVTIKYDSNGGQVWLKRYNGPDDETDIATQIELDDLGNVYVAGHSYDNNDDFDFLIRKYDNNGNTVWTSRFDGANGSFDIPEAIYVDATYNVYITGSSFGGLPTDNDYATVKYNAAGTEQWARYYNGAGNLEDKAFDIVVDGLSNVYVTGRTLGVGSAQDMTTIKYDVSGVVLWADTYNGPSSGYDDAQQMRLGASGALYVTGYSAGNGTNNDYLTLKYDTLNGNILWEARFDGPASNSDQAFDMEIDASENIYVTGTSNDPASNQDFSTIKWCQLTTNAGADTAICIGDNVQLNAMAPGGFNYQWTPTTGLSNPNISNPIANPSVTTTYVVSAENSIGCVDFDTIVITVNPLPLNTISASGPTTFCVGDSVILTADNIGTYNWTPANDTTQSITIFSTGNYTVDIIDSNSCFTQAQQAVTVNPLPSVSVGSDLSVCDGDSIQLNATGANTYTWNTQTTLTDSTISNPFAYPTSPTNYWVVGEDLNGCKSVDTIFVAISVSPVAKMSNSTLNDTLDLNFPNGGDIQFFSTLSTNALDFYWDFDDGGTDTVANPTHTYKSGDDFTIMLVATNGACSDTIYHTIFVIKGVSVGENHLDNYISVYPNPATDFVRINFKGIEPQGASFTVYNAIGEIVKQISSTINTNSNISINTKEFKQGLYFIEVRLDKKTEMFRAPLFINK